MTSHLTYERLGLMVSADMLRRVENAAWRDSGERLFTTGEWINQAIRRAVEASERGELVQPEPNEGK